MGNKVTVGTDICGDLEPLVNTSLDCSMCTIGFPQFGGQVGLAFYSSEFCPTTAIEPNASVWLNGWYTSLGQLKCKQPGFNAEPDPGLFIAEGYFNGVSYTNPQTNNTASHQFRWRVEMRPVDHYTVGIIYHVWVLGPGAVWHTYTQGGFNAHEVLGPNDDASIPYRSRQFVPGTGTQFLNWKGETANYPPAANPDKGDVYTTAPGNGDLPSPPFPADTPEGMSFYWDGSSWQTGGFTTRWDYEKIRASDGQPYGIRRFIQTPINTTYAGFGDDIKYVKFVMGTESLREGCGGGGNAFPVCGMWSPLADDTQGAAWHTCFRAILRDNAGDESAISVYQLGVDMPDCGKRFLVDDGTMQYGPFCGCDQVTRKPWGWESLKNDDIPCFYPEVVNIGVPGEATGQVQEIQTNGTGSIVVKQIDGGPLYACHGVATGTDGNGCTTMDWEIVQVTQVMRTGSPYIYRVQFPQHNKTLYLHSLRFPSDPIMPSACINAAQTTLEDVVVADTPPEDLSRLRSVGKGQALGRLKLNCIHLGPRRKNSGYG
jgi:ribosome modulation factor